ncbi:class I SAM-dependent methyltransferase [Acidovorax sp. NO-1]|uniref:class I SAM-dependent methyltransferase n=1 Tax=Acidovorax sp. NO-1 TaxID=512030 RepID=UPI0005500AC7|nr:class I SAM-dependent methyltransferase [Acidovorax sp. NO-1]
MLSKQLTASRPSAPASTQKSILTREEIKHALAADRIFVARNLAVGDESYMDAHLRDYPYAMLVYTGPLGNIRVADAWRFNARGEVYPGHITPVPVILSELHRFDQAASAVRRNLIAHTQATRQIHAGFVNEPTMRAAQVLSSDSAAWSYLAEAAPTGPDWLGRASRALRHFATAHRTLFSPNPISLSEVEWAEVAAQFDSETLPKPAAKTIQAKAPVKMTVLGGDMALEVKDMQTADAAGSKLPDRAIPPDVLEVLRQAHAQGPHIYLPTVQLDKALYSRVDKVLRELGGKWVGGSRRAHTFDVDAQDILYAAVATGRYVRPADLGFFPTPAALVNKLLAKAKLERGMLVIEPQAGDGRIACPMAAAVGGTELVTTCELMERNVQKLREAGFQNVIHGDFLRVAPSPKFAAACMNPPFSRHQDIDHVLHASRFVQNGGTVTSYMSSAWMHSTHKRAQEFKRFLDAVKAEVEQVDPGAFRESGTDVATTLVHFSV